MSLVTSALIEDRTNC
uniref:Uncharacterized protein n=1 Tax=Lepeophtheirus salmonis TaxID=72036 RepID=A0A0K2UB67_LEPSM